MKLALMALFASLAVTVLASAAVSPPVDLTAPTAVLRASTPGGIYPGTYPYRFADFILPRDEGKHSLRIASGFSPLEWWYIVSSLEGGNGRHYFVFLCWFSTNSLQVGVTEYETGRRWTYAERYLPNQINAAAGRLNLNFAGNTLINTEPFVYRANVSIPGVETSLSYYSDRPPFPVGEENGRPGYITYPHNGYTWYYTMGRLRTEGKLKLDGVTIDVSGWSWLDRQWGAFAPMSDWRWEWMALQLKIDRGDHPLSGLWDINCWNLRDTRSGELIWTMATALYPDNTVQVGVVRMEALDYWTSPRGYTYSHGWRVTPTFCRTLPLKLLVIPVAKDQTQPAAGHLGTILPENEQEFWEGACEVRLDRPGQKVVGWAVTELTMHYERGTR